MRLHMSQLFPERGGIEVFFHISLQSGLGLRTLEQLTCNITSSMSFGSMPRLVCVVPVFCLVE